MQLFPQFTPWNVWDIPVSLWWVLAEMTDEAIARGRENA